MKFVCLLMGFAFRESLYLFFFFFLHWIGLLVDVVRKKSEKSIDKLTANSDYCY